MKNIIIAIIILVNIVLAQNIFADNISQQSLQDVITQYLNLKNALTNDNSSEAATDASGLLTALDNLQIDNLTKSELKTWNKYSKKLKMHAEHISEYAGNIEHQREHFAALSAGMYSVLKTIKGNTNELYYQYCPMAEDSKGAYWISEKSEIVNPYMGQKMSTCGSTKNTIKAN